MATIYAALLLTTLVSLILTSRADPLPVQCSGLGFTCHDASHYSWCVANPDGDIIAVQQVDTCPNGMRCDVNSDVACTNVAFIEPLNYHDNGGESILELVHIAPTPEDSDDYNPSSQEPAVSTVEDSTIQTEGTSAPQEESTVTILPTSSSEESSQTSTENLDTSTENLDTSTGNLDTSTSNLDTSTSNPESLATNSESQPSNPSSPVQITKTTDHNSEFSESQTTAIPKSPTVEFVCPDSGRFPAQESCSLYHVCYRFFWIRKHFVTTCEQDFEFSPSRQRCVPKNNSDCTVGRKQEPADDDSDSDDSDESSE